ncbi:MAG TPA: SurA N-terminal domain-containing protein [bacterium]|nr:SurA N-terminal domain-containing protein [bacterium]
MRRVLVLPALLVLGLALAPARASEARIVDKIIAVINSEIITYSELEEKLNPIIIRLLNEQRQVTPELKKQALDELIRERLVLQEAQRRGVVVEEAEVEARVTKLLAEVSANFLDAAEFQEALRENGMTVEVLRQRYREQAKRDLILSTLYRTELGPEINVTPDDVRQEYHVRHILCATEEEARMAQTNLEKGVDFSIVATHQSIDPHAARGGDWGYIRLGTMPDEVDAIIVTLEEGAVSNLIHHRGGYSIVQLVGKRKLEASEMPDQETRSLMDHLRMLKLYGQIDAWQRKLWNSNFVEIKDRF